MNGIGRGRDSGSRCSCKTFGSEGDQLNGVVPGGGRLFIGRFSSGRHDGVFV